MPMVDGVNVTLISAELFGSSLKSSFLIEKLSGLERLALNSIDSFKGFSSFMV